MRHVIVFCVLLALPASAQVVETDPLREPGFYGLGFLDGDTESTAQDVSGDGSIVVGFSESEGSCRTAFRWEAGSMEAIPGVGDCSLAMAVSHDGSVIAGVDLETLGAFRWENGAVEDLGSISTSYETGVTDMSGDGLVIVGMDGHYTYAAHEAFRWENGVMEGLGFLSYPVSEAYGISSDRATIVGSSWGYYGTFVTEAFVWHADTGMVSLRPALIGSGQFDISPDLSGAYEVAGDGTVVAGLVRETNGPSQVFRWDDGTVSALTPPIQALQRLAMSESGDVVFWSEGSGANRRAVVWDAANGARDLTDFLSQELGWDIDGWTLTEVAEVSADGRTLVGTGVNPDGGTEAWRAVLPPVCSDGLDNDGDGAVDQADPGCALGEASVAEDPECDDGIDNDGDGLVDFEADPGCFNAGIDDESPACDDGLDNDGDGLIDFPDDSQCIASWAFSERGCGLGFELALVLPPLMALRARRGPRSTRTPARDA